MTDTRPTVPPISGHYAMLRNGHVILYAPRPRGQGNEADAAHDAEGRAWCGSEGDEYARPAFDIIATISPATLAFAIEVENTPAVDPKSVYPDEKPGVWVNSDDFAAYKAILPLAEAVLDHADQHCRAFPIATAPKEKWIEVWCDQSKMWFAVYTFPDYVLQDTVTHWKFATPSPSNPPLPEVFTDLRAALEKIRGNHD